MLKGPTILLATLKNVGRNIVFNRLFLSTLNRLSVFCSVKQALVSPRSILYSRLGNVLVKLTSFNNCQWFCFCINIVHIAGSQPLWSGRKSISSWKLSQSAHAMFEREVQECSAKFVSCKSFTHDCSFSKWRSLYHTFCNLPKQKYFIWY